MPTKSRWILDTDNAVNSEHSITECSEITAVQRSAPGAIPAAPFALRERPAVSDGRLQRVLDIIDAQPSQSVRTLALEVRLSPAHLQRLFRQQTGIHIRDLIVEGRLQKAARLLSASTMQIKEIAYTVGYQHHSSFVRAFQRRFAQAPRHYRRHVSVGG